MPTRDNTVALRAALQKNPDVTLAQLAVEFGCNIKTVARRLKAVGLRTRSWAERTHTPEARAKMSVAAQGRTGSKNPNYGPKRRPWLEGANHPWSRWHTEHPEFGERQRGMLNPIHQVEHLYSDPDYVHRITRGIRAHVASKRGRSYEDVYGDEAARAYKEKLRAASPARLRASPRKATTPERIVERLLIQLGLDYEPQAPIGPYVVDFVVRSHRLVVQADGDYWHANPQVYPQRELLGLSQRVASERDVLCNEYLEQQGYSVVRLWESDLAKHPDHCAAQIRRKCI